MVGLFPHIAHDQGVEIMCHFLDKREDESVSSESLYRKASGSLSSKCNAKDIIKRLPSSLRTTIGMKFAPHYADIFMVGSVEEIFEKFHFQPTFGCVICMIF